MGILTHLDELAKDASNDSIIVECKKALLLFIDNNERTFTFSDISNKEYNKLMNDFVTTISLEHVLSVEVLQLMRILSRDKKLVTTMDVDVSMKLFRGLYERECEMASHGYVCKVEILKCLCNWAYHSQAVRNYLLNDDLMRQIITQVKSAKMNDDIFYQIRLIFLISALESSERTRMLEYGAFTALVSITKEVLKMKDNVNEENMHRYLTEILKAFFNVSLQLGNCSSESIRNDCDSLVKLLREMVFLFYPFDHRKADDLLTHIVNLLLNMQTRALSLFTVNLDSEPIQESVALKLKECKHALVFEGHDLSSVVILLDALETRIEFKSYELMKEKTLTILTVFSYVCRSNRIIRRYLKDEILPSLPVSNVRPEEQAGLRGDIIKLMQAVDIPLKNMAADFLFVLCKENTTRLIKYTGYGNSAGFLAIRGLMIPTGHIPDGDYSEDELSDDESSANIDVVTGATALPKEDVFANLTESEKEQEIDNLISMTQRLRELNVVKPVGVNSEGKFVELNNIGVDANCHSDSD